MEKELILLRNLYTNPELTQREMAKATGVSLGSVNSLIKELVKMGIVKVEKVKRKTILYYLTTKGCKRKAELTYKYILEAYVFLKKLSLKIDNLIESKKEEDYRMVVFGDKDEICELIEQKLKEKGIDFKTVVTFDEIKSLSEQNDIFILVWQPENISLVKDIKLCYMYLLDCI